VTGAAIVLVDTNIVIEAVRTRIWNSISGGRRIVTVQECADELARGHPDIGAKYVTVTPDDIARALVLPLSIEASVRFRLEYADAAGLDAGERDLLALAAVRIDDFQICSSDKAALRAAQAMGFIDRVVSLEAVADSVGARADPRLRRQFTEAQMRTWRTSLRIGGSI
jgi:hypothetical protein